MYAGESLHVFGDAKSLMVNRQIGHLLTEDILL